ncbi:MAG: hypothetical protein L0Y61_09405 [Epsilonproteobacteria bacterium]|nr:hypothetical protein [Campylobacterota bacterium]
MSLEERIKKDPLRFLASKNRKIVQSPFWISDPVLRRIQYRYRLYQSLSKIKDIRLQAELRLLEAERKYNQKKQRIAAIAFVVLWYMLIVFLMKTRI